MVDGFFSEVPERIRFGGLDSTDPLTFKVYEPDRVVLGKRMADHLRIGVCLWHSFAWDGRDMFGIGTLDRPWLDPTADPMQAARQKMAVAFEFIEKLGTPYYCFHDRDVAPEGASFAEFRDNLDALTDRRTRLPVPDGRDAALGHGQPIHPPPLPGRRGHEPRSRGLRLRRGPGQAHARGHQASRWHELRPVGRPRGLRHPAQHRPQARGRPAGPVPPPRRRAQAPHRVRGQPADRAQADGADQAPVRLRLGDDPRLPRPERARGRVPTEHRGEPRDPRRPLVPSRGRLRRGERDARQHRREPRRPAERLGHRPVPEFRRGPGPADLRDPEGRRVHDRAGSTSTRSCAARARTGPTCSMPTSAASTRSPRRCSSQPISWSAGPSRSHSRSATRAGTVRSAGRSSTAGKRSRRSRRRSRPARSTRVRCRATRSCSRASSTSASGPPSANRSRRAPAADRGARPRGRRLDDGDEGRPDRRGRRRRRRRERRVPVRHAPAAVERAGPSPVVGRGGRGDRGRHWRRPVAPERTSWRSASPARCTGSCCSTRRIACSGRRSCGTTSGPPPSATRSGRRSVPSG